MWPQPHRSGDDGCHVFFSKSLTIVENFIAFKIHKKETENQAASVTASFKENKLLGMKCC